LTDVDDEGANMNLYAILGAAVMNEKFAEELFREPYAAVNSLNITLTTAEFAVLLDMIKRGGENGLPKLFMELRGRICPPGMVCPWILATREPKIRNATDAAA
jgi:hypothetical protein